MPSKRSVTYPRTNRLFSSTLGTHITRHGHPHFRNQWCNVRTVPKFLSHYLVRQRAAQVFRISGLGNEKKNRATYAAARRGHTALQETCLHSFGTTRSGEDVLPWTRSAVGFNARNRFTYVAAIGRQSTYFWFDKTCFESILGADGGRLRRKESLHIRGSEARPRHAQAHLVVSSRHAFKRTRLGPNINLGRRRRAGSARGIAPHTRQPGAATAAPPAPAPLPHRPAGPGLQSIRTIQRQGAVTHIVYGSAVRPAAAP